MSNFRMSDMGRLPRLFCCVIGLLWMHASVAAAPARSTLDLDGTWKFFPAFSETTGSHRSMEGEVILPDAAAVENPDKHYGWILPGFDDAGWWDIPVPSTWDSVFEELWGYEGQGWYRKEIVIPRDWQGKRVCFLSGGANYRTVLYVNGVRIGAHEGGFTAFQFPIHEALKFGEKNTLAVAVDNITTLDRVPMERFGWWHYGGLFRSVGLEATEPCYVEDVVVETDALTDPPQVRLAIACASEGNGPGEVSVKVTLRNAAGGLVAESADSLSLEGPRATMNCILPVPAAQLWSPENPNLYQLAVELTDPATGQTDLWTQRIGIRSITIQNGQFLLNGKPYLIKGINRHEDYAETGGTSTEVLLRRDLQLIKDLGANAVRCHYPNSPRTYELFDEMGLLTVCEVPLYHWGRPGHSNANLEAAKHQLDEMIRQLRNHPCVAFWSVSNETRIRSWTDDPEEIQRAAMVAAGNKELVDLAHALDTTRPVIEPSNRWPEDEVFEKTDVSAINVYLHISEPHVNKVGEMEQGVQESFAKLRALHPGKPILVSEFGSWALRGLKTPYYPGEGYQAAMLETQWNAFMKEENFIGGFVWVFADHDLHRKYISIYAMRCAYGLYDRHRQPKASAETMRTLWKGTE